MFRSGASPVRRAIRRLTGFMSVGAALVLLVGGVTVFGSHSLAGASTTTVSTFAVNPSSVNWVGATVTLSAKVANATTCTFSATPAVKALPVKKTCTNGTVDEKVAIPKNSGVKTITYSSVFRSRVRRRSRQRR